MYKGLHTNFRLRDRCCTWRTRTLQKTCCLFSLFATPIPLSSSLRNCGCRFLKQASQNRFNFQRPAARLAHSAECCWHALSEQGLPVAQTCNSLPPSPPLPRLASAEKEAFMCVQSSDIPSLIVTRAPTLVAGAAFSLGQLNSLSQSLWPLN